MIVVDSQGNEYEATYPKRAKGLVKSGRARFVGENKICLACPPNEYLEDENMEENKNITVAEKEQNDQPTVAYILGQIEKIFADNKHIQEALAKLENVRSEGPGDLGAQAKAQGIADVVKCRETTNQQMLRFYEKLYDDIKPKTDEHEQKLRKQFLDFVRDTTVAADAGSILPDFEKIWKAVYLGR